MSAYQVSNKHITALIMGVCKIRFMGDRLFDASGEVDFWWNGQRQSMTTDEAGRLLSEENSRSVDARYQNHDEVEGFAIDFPGKITPMDVLKLANGYSYQACETDDWQETKAFALIDFIKADAIRKLPGYDDAKWSI